MRVNLLPPEVRRARRDAGILRQIRFFGFAALLLMSGLYAIRTVEVVFLKGDLEDIRTQQAAVEAERQALADVAASRDAAAAGKALASQLVRGEISWSRQLLKLADSVPVGFTLSSVSGQPSGGSGSALSGSVTFSAVSKDFLPVRTWLMRISAEEGWTNGWVSSISPGDTGFGVSGSYDLTASAISARGGGPA